MSDKPKKKTAHQRSLDDQGVVSAQSKLAKAAEDYVELLLASEMDPAYIPIKYYLNLVEASTVSKRYRQRQACSMVVDCWPHTDDGSRIYDDMTLASCYEEETNE